MRCDAKGANVLSVAILGPASQTERDTLTMVKKVVELSKAELLELVLSRIMLQQREDVVAQHGRVRFASG